MRSAFFAVGLALAASSCVAETPPGDMAAPDPSKIIVFFPIDGEVRGRGSPGAAPSGATHIYIAPHPSPGEQVVEVNADGSFSFHVIAGSSDILEFAGASDGDALDRGDPTYVQVPFARTFEEDFYCCRNPGARRGRCIRASDDAPMCNEDPILGCQTDADCAVHSQRLTDFPEDALDIVPPDETGRIRVAGKEGKLPPLALVQVENRGQRATGGRDPRLRAAEVTDERGVFQMSFPADGDDELVFQLYEFDGIRSPYHAVRVPDSKLAGADIVGVFPFDLLVPEQTGRVAIRISPFGEDGKGICPDSGSDPILCFGGGLDYSMVSITSVEIDGAELATQVTRTMPSAELPATRATDGDVVKTKQVLMLVLDTSAEARRADPEGIRYRIATDFVNAVRSRDLLGIISAGGLEGEHKLEVSPTGNKEALRTTIIALEARNPVENSGADIFGAIQLAAKQIGAQTAFESGQLMVVTTQMPSGARARAEIARQAVFENENIFFRGYPTYVVGLNLLQQERQAPEGTPPNASALRDVAAFSDGEFIDLTEPRSMIQTMARLTGVVSGAFVLLYDVPIPAGTGKAAAIRISANLTLPGDEAPQSATAAFTGILEVRGGN